jgi:hypothetical protein
MRKLAKEHKGDEVEKVDEVEDSGNPGKSTRAYVRERIGSGTG